MVGHRFVPVNPVAARSRLTGLVAMVNVRVVNSDDGFGAAPVASAITHGS